MLDISARLLHYLMYDEQIVIPSFDKAFMQTFHRACYTI